MKTKKFCDECYEQGRLKAQQEILKMIEKMQENDVATKGYYRKIEAEELKQEIISQSADIKHSRKVGQDGCKVVDEPNSCKNDKTADTHNQKKIRGEGK